MSNVWPCSAEDAPKHLISKTQANGGLAPVDLDKFWADQDVAVKDPFGKDIPQAPLGVLMSGECIPTELGIPEDQWRYQNDEPWRLELNKAYNDKAEKIVGRRLLGEKPGPAPDRQYPEVKWLHDIFEARNEWNTVSQSYWLHQSANTPDELKALLNRVEKRLENLREFILPPNWEAEKKRLTALGVKPPLYRGQRGPITFATSVYGLENLIFLIMEDPTLAVRFRDAIAKAMLSLGRVLDEDAGYTPATAPHGFGVCDDNCYLMTPDMYELFGYPILKAVFERYCPDPKDSRFQHSDSPMGHMLPILGRLNLTGTNFGPTVTVAEIRRHLPRAVIYGQLAPFTFSRNEEENIVAEFIRDFQQAREQRGLFFSTAGSINNGSRLTGMRLIMSAIQHFGRY